MRDVPLDPRSPAEEDPAVHQHLAALRAFTPSPGLAERVLVRVWLPLPPRLRRLRDWAGTELTRRRMWMAAIPLIAGTLVTAVTVGALVASYPTEAGRVVGFAIEHGVLALWRGGLEAVASAWLALGETLGFTALTVAQALSVTLAGMILMAACAWGLYRTVGADVPVRMGTHAKR